MYGFQKAAVAVALVLAGVVTAGAAPRMLQDRAGVWYEQDISGVWRYPDRVVRDRGYVGTRALGPRSAPFLLEDELGSARASQETTQ
jgi:hypothetical protein